MAIARTYDERIALIKEVAERRKKMTAIKSKSQLLKNTVSKKTTRSFMDVPKETNIYAYTDAPKYAKEYYGETMYQTTRYDNDWD